MTIISRLSAGSSPLLLSLVCAMLSVVLPIRSVHASILPHHTQAEVLAFLETYAPTATNGDATLNFMQLVQQLQDKRVVFVGETHDRYDHHLNQLAILKALHQQNPRIGIGLEWFQQSFQSVLDDYLAGRITEAELLQRSGYYSRWRYDYRMLRPIIEFAKINHLPLIALNAPAEITAKLADGGLESLSAAERAQIPAQINPPGESYLERLQQVFASHTRHSSEQGQFANFALVQRVWDETMAANVVKFLQARADYRMVVFAGSGHVSKEAGIPVDVARSLPAAPMAVLVNSEWRDVKPEAADYFLISPMHTLPPTGKLGVWLDPRANGIYIGKLLEHSAAAQAGLLQNDRIAKVNDEPIQSMEDLLMLLARYKPGDKVNLLAERTDEVSKIARSQTFTVILQ